MWRPRRRAIAALLLLGGFPFGGVRAFAEPPAIAERQWIHPDADAIAALTTRPTECFGAPVDPDRARLARLGRVAFRSPVLLGGLAARVGLSCDSCHRNGHDNPVFFFAGVSGGPGTADVTGSVFSTHREDGLRNPVAIPSLIDVASKTAFGSIRPASELRVFVLAAIVDEFQGEPPPPPVVEGMLEYLGGLRSSACPERGQEAIRFESEARDALETLDVVIESFDQADRLAGEFALLSLRAALERIYRRFPSHLATRDALVRSSRALAALRARLGEISESEAGALLAVERTRFEAVTRALEKDAERSFYDRSVLGQALR